MISFAVYGGNFLFTANGLKTLQGVVKVAPVTLNVFTTHTHNGKRQE
jgi:hypothetical protein